MNLAVTLLYDRIIEGVGEGCWMKSPYEALPSQAFWRTGVTEVQPHDLHGLYRKKWPIATNWRIATAGSCFAQHISRHLGKHGYNVLQMEPAPPGLPEKLHNTFGYSIYSARYGNIYTVHQLRQLALEIATGESPRDIIWENDGRYYDALRPGVEPKGLNSPEEVMAHRAYHLERVRKMFETMDLFVFTLGLTEAWVGKSNETVYPTAPGTIAGDFDRDKYAFRNFRFGEIIDAFQEFQSLLTEIRSGAVLPRILLTVSPVPLTGTASGRHVLQATTYSKAVLRAAADELARSHDHIDYFPSYEVITNPAAKASFYEENLRSVRREGVEAVMKIFFREHRMPGMQPTSEPTMKPRPALSMDQMSTSQSVPSDFAEQCEEALIEAFSK